MPSVCSAGVCADLATYQLSCIPVSEMGSEDNGEEQGGGGEPEERILIGIEALSVMTG